MGVFRRMPPVTLVIPARFRSSRFPGKPLTMLRGPGEEPKPLIQWAWEAARRVPAVDRILVATDDRWIADAVTALGGEVVMTSPACRNGSERCAEAIRRAGVRNGIVVNLQGDAPLTPPDAIAALVRTLAGDSRIAVASPMLRCRPAMAIRLAKAARRGTPGGVTVVVDRRSDALYFSRHVLPWSDEGGSRPPVFMHLGVYAYRAAALRRYAAGEPSDAEVAEGLEQLRFLHLGMAIRMIEIAEPPGGLWEVNHPADVPLVEAALRVRGTA
ncbi:MAG TPA: 3-deoxy-manno-octulosonate cytidylyltransferase [Sphingomonas sp.]|nr:3-deoxy-manno-octulosonate cytidylyltransferase [Sphingomonas sp.]